MKPYKIVYEKKELVTRKTNFWERLKTRKEKITEMQTFVFTNFVTSDDIPKFDVETLKNLNLEVTGVYQVGTVLKFENQEEEVK